LKYESAVGDERKQDSPDPREDVRDMDVHTCTVEEKGDAPIDRGGHAAKQNVKTKLAVLFVKFFAGRYHFASIL
jgi:hypothetical protein